MTLRVRVYIISISVARRENLKTCRYCSAPCVFYFKFNLPVPFEYVYFFLCPSFSLRGSEMQLDVSEFQHTNPMIFSM